MPDAVPTDALLSRLAALETGQLSDVLEEAGLPYQVLSSALAPVGPSQRLCGRAACASGEEVKAGTGSAPNVKTLEDIVSAGSVLVVEAGGFTETSITGGIVAFSLQLKGCIGLVTDGAIRDAGEMVESGFACFAPAVTPIAGRKRWRLTSTGEPITMPGQLGTRIAVAPGDLILADGDGIVVIPQAVSERIIEDSEELARIETRITAELKAGATRAEAFSRNPRFSHVRKT